MNASETFELGRSANLPVPHFEFNQVIPEVKKSDELLEIARLILPKNLRA